MRELVLYTLLGTWAVLGFILWIPLLTRTMAIYMLRAVAVAVSGGNLLAEQQALDYAVEFFGRGFHRIKSSFSGNAPAATVALQGNLQWQQVNWTTVFATFLWTILFWVGTLGPVFYLSAT